MNWSNFEFLNPEFLWLLILIPLLAVWHFFMRKKDTAVLTMPSVKGFKGGSFLSKLKPILYLFRLLALSAIIIADKASSLNRYRIGFNFDKNEPPLKPFTLGIVKTAVSFLRIKKCQTANSGMSISNQRNSGFKNSKLLQFIFFFYYLFRL